MPGASGLRTYLRVGDGKWEQVQPQVNEGRLIFNLDPSKLGTGVMMLLINPPAGLVMDDGDAPLDDAVEQRGFPDIRTANDGDEI